MLKILSSTYLVSRYGIYIIIYLNEFICCTGTGNAAELHCDP